MSITDELREWAHGFNGPWKRNEEMLLAIADRIDAEHEAKVSYWQGASYKDGYDEGFAGADDWLGQHEDAMAEHGWVMLPVDADGEYIHIGDVMEWVRYGDDDPTIVRTVIGVGFEVFFAWSDEQGRYAQYEANAYRHYHAPTVEDVLREFAVEVCGEPALTIRSGVVEEYASRLRLAGES